MDDRDLRVGRAQAAACGLATGLVPDEVEVGLPQGARVTFPVVGAGPVGDGVGKVPGRRVKDAGDGPDCPDGPSSPPMSAGPGGATETALVAGPGWPRSPSRAGPGGRAPAINPCLTG